MGVGVEEGNIVAVGVAVSGITITGVGVGKGNTESTIGVTTGIGKGELEIKGRFVVLVTVCTGTAGVVACATVSGVGDAPVDACGKKICPPGFVIEMTSAGPGVGGVPRAIISAP